MKNVFLFYSYTQSKKFYGNFFFLKKLWTNIERHFIPSRFSLKNFTRFSKQRKFFKNLCEFHWSIKTLQKFCEKCLNLKNVLKVLRKSVEKVFFKISWRSFLVKKIIFEISLTISERFFRKITFFVKFGKHCKHFQRKSC